MIRTFQLGLLLCLSLAFEMVIAAEQPSVVQSKQASFRVVELADGLEHPWGMVFLPDGRMLVTERPGRLRIVGKDGELSAPLKGLPSIVARGQGGLLDVALDPAFKENSLVYISYAGQGDDGTGTEVARGKLGDDTLQDLEVIFRALPKMDSNHHFGSRLQFDREGRLFITLGDRGDKDQAQQLGSHNGSIIRINADGSVPKDNPFMDREGAKPEIYTYGNRNVQGLALHPVTGQIWAHEHGPQGGDEINIVKPAVNYGWPVITYGRNYGIGTKIGEGTAKPGMEQPLYYWVPSIAPSGMAFYDGDAFPEWRGDLFVGALKDQMLVRLELKDGKIVDEERLLKNELGRIRDVNLGPDELFYLLTDADDGKLVRLEPVKKSAK
ncbi:MAG TPA: PQQ-dependent sugar dehydrogenase [Gammaproteobacteria bacterium]